MQNYPKEEIDGEVVGEYDCDQDGFESDGVALESVGKGNVTQCADERGSDEGDTHDVDPLVAECCQVYMGS